MVKNFRFAFNFEKPDPKAKNFRFAFNFKIPKDLNGSKGHVH